MTSLCYNHFYDSLEFQPPITLLLWVKSLSQLLYFPVFSLRVSTFFLWVVYSLPTKRVQSLRSLAVCLGEQRPFLSLIKIPLNELFPFMSWFPFYILSNRSTLPLLTCLASPNLIRWTNNLNLLSSTYSFIDFIPNYFLTFSFRLLSTPLIPSIFWDNSFTTCSLFFCFLASIQFYLPYNSTGKYTEL